MTKIKDREGCFNAPAFFGVTEQERMDELRDEVRNIVKESRSEGDDWWGLAFKKLVPDNMKNEHGFRLFILTQVASLNQQQIDDQKQLLKLLGKMK